MADDERALIEAIGLSPIAMVASNPRRPDNPLELANEAFCKLTGYSEAEILGRNCRFLAGPATDPATNEQIRAAVRDARPVLVDIVNYRRDGRAFRNGVMITPLFGPEGELAWFLGSQVDLGPQADGALARRQSGAAEKVAALPARRRQVLQLMARGLLNKQIAWELKISERTVKMHRALLLDGLGVATSAEAIRMAVEAGL
ncbi:LuxR C-terminal-related transcriptional regulator [Phenylobacterium sp.]|jgi:PAS domain S-box-containing protein|uniref:LuxR C-terminal-related transcriptional regulator n=1 Tax=Phenylobacterium sp. TaxID=1871053 RepID=UPI002F95AF0A